MATKTKTKSKAKPKARKLGVQLIALGNRPVTMEVKRGTDLADFVEANIPASWGRDQFETRVNNVVKNGDYILNEGDQVSFAPHTAGGDKQ